MRNISEKVKLTNTAQKDIKEILKMRKTKMILQFTGYRDFSDDKIYKNEEGIFFSKDDYNDIIYIGKDPDNDPMGSVKTLSKYKDIDFVTVGDEDLPTEAERFNYMMLGRLESDCKYYLGYGNRYKHHLYYHDEQKHIDEMKKLYNSFSDDKKPEWLTWEQILNYKELMVDDL